MDKNGRERREFPRLKQDLPIKLASNGYDFATSTQDVSCAGTYCTIQKYIPPFTKVLIKLTLPMAPAVSNKNYEVECKGVVVRSDDEPGGGFNVAVFFNEIKDEQKKKISQYINQFLPKDPSALQRA